MSETAHEAMARIDAEHLLQLAKDLIRYMPQVYKEALQGHRALRISLDKHEVEVRKR